MPDAIKANRPAADRREIRVFISSTFRDMQEEREELVKQIFPQLRRLCESRGVTWGEVDLRWGVPDEAKAEGKVLPLCLQEIEHCRPYFIGLLGERYGWVPEEIPEALFETQPWLREHLHKSVTALEILHGVLLDPEMEKHAFFYFRDPAYAAAHPGFTEENPARRQQLEVLKDDIRRSSFPVKEPFATPKQLGEWVLHDLTAVIERLYPETQIPTELDRAALDHEAYSASRRTVYIGRDEYMTRLNAHAAGDGPPLVIMGESGGGKSALVANWTHHWSQQHPETPVLVHFIGAAPDSANWMAMLRRLLSEFQRKFGIQIEIPDQPDALRMTFANALSLVAARGRLVLALDALNQIEDRDGAPDLVWLPPMIPDNVRLIVSTLPGRSREELKKREWPVMAVEPLTVPEREELIDKYLKRYAKTLSPGPAHRITAAPQTGNSLFLSTLLNELRQFGSYEQLDQRIDWYLQAANPVELYRKVVQRWEQDYGQPEQADADAVRGSLAQRIWGALHAKSKPAHTSVVQKSLERLWAARRGLSESELLESLGMAGSPLPRALWSPLYLAAGDALVNRGGLLTFAHDFLREAVREAYLPSKAHEQAAHHTLATYFEAQQQGPRPLDELPWQWQEAGEWQKLADLLAAAAVFEALWGKNQFEVKTYWTQIQSHSSLRMERVYESVMQNPTRDAYHAWRIGMLLADTGKPEAALRLRAGLVDHYRARGDRASLQGALGNQALILKARGDLDGAMALHKEEERICRELGNKDGLQFSLGNQAAILYVRGDLDGAMALNKEVERICRELGNKDVLQRTLGSQAGILYARGDLDGAMALYKDQERICRELGNKDGLQESLGNQALILYARDDLDGAMALHKGKERICRELGNKDGLQVSLCNQAAILKDCGDLDGAMALMKEQERICRELGNKDGLQISLGNQALILQDRGELDGAMALLKEQERICRELGKKDSLQISMGNQALILKARGDLDGAMALYKEQERICRELGNPKGLSISLANQANLLKRLPGRRGEARRLAEEALRIATRHGYQQLITGIQRIRDSIPAE
jgi:tetratricopeptide (TPR) repeat protein